MKKPRATILLLLVVLWLSLAQSAALTKTGDSSGARWKVMRLSPVGGGEHIAMRAARRGNPWINLRDGIDLRADYAGAIEVQQLMQPELTLPRTLAAGDFDEDGIPDLIGGYLGPSGGALTLRRGNIDSIFPHSLEAQDRRANGRFSDAPFLSPGRVFETPAPPEYLAAGDFDADGHLDVVAAGGRSEALYWLPGDGQGGWARPDGQSCPGA